LAFVGACVQFCSDSIFNPEYLGKTGNTEGRFMTPQPRDWRHLAEQASKEMDPEKMMILVNDLNRELEFEYMHQTGKKTNTNAG
jgi:hypothetical protein